jgi:hypothetical protein
MPVECATAPAVIWRLRISVAALRGIDDVWVSAVEAAIRGVEQDGELEEQHRHVIDVAIEQDKTRGPGLMARDLTELLTLVDARRVKRPVAPPPCTKKQLLAVPCPTCGAQVGSYCELRPGKVLLLPQHHAERFWAAQTAKGSELSDHQRD